MTSRNTAQTDKSVSVCGCVVSRPAGRQQRGAALPRVTGTAARPMEELADPAFLQELEQLLGKPTTKEPEPRAPTHAWVPTVGQRVELAMPDPGMVGSWYIVTVREVDAEADSVLVEVHGLLDDQDQQLMEKHRSAALRPLAPETPAGFAEQLQLNYLAELWTDDGWWEVLVKQIKGGRAFSKKPHDPWIDRAPGWEDDSGSEEIEWTDDDDLPQRPPQRPPPKKQSGSKSTAKAASAAAGKSSAKKVAPAPSSSAAASKSSSAGGSSSADGPSAAAGPTLSAGSSSSGAGSSSSGAGSSSAEAGSSSAGAGSSSAGAGPSSAAGSSSSSAGPSAAPAGGSSGAGSSTVPPEPEPVATEWALESVQYGKTHWVEAPKLRPIWLWKPDAAESEPKWTTFEKWEPVPKPRKRKEAAAPPPEPTAKEVKQEQAAREREALLSQYAPSQLVEVRGTEEGFLGSWYAARVLEVKEARHAVRLAVSYVAFQEDDGGTMKETADHSRVRPVPPAHRPDFVSELKKGAPLELELDDGWWEVEYVGRDGSKHVVAAKRYNVRLRPSIAPRPPKLAPEPRYGPAQPQPRPAPLLPSTGQVQHTVTASKLRPAWKWEQSVREWAVHDRRPSPPSKAEIKAAPKAKSKPSSKAPKREASCMAPEQPQSRSKAVVAPRQEDVPLAQCPRNPLCVRGWKHIGGCRLSKAPAGPEAIPEPKPEPMDITPPPPAEPSVPSGGSGGQEPAAGERKAQAGAELPDDAALLGVEPAAGRAQPMEDGSTEEGQPLGGTASGPENVPIS